MGLIDIVKPLSTVLSSAVNNSQQHQEKNSWECQESNPGPLDEKQVCYLCAMQPPRLQKVKVMYWAHGCSAVVEHLPRDHEVVGLNPAWCWAFSSSSSLHFPFLSCLPIIIKSLSDLN